MKYSSPFFCLSMSIAAFCLIFSCTGLMSGPESTIKQQVQMTYGSGFHSFEFKLTEQKDNLCMYIVQFKEASSGGPTRVYVAQAVVAKTGDSWECTNLIFIGGVEPKRAFSW